MLPGRSDTAPPHLRAGTYGVKATASGPAGSSLASWEAAAKVYADAAHQHGVKLLISFGGDGSSGAYWTVFESATTDALAAQLAGVMVAEVQKTGADGIDVDWEGGSDDGSGKMRIVRALRAEWSTAFLSLTLGAAYNGASSLTKFAAVEDQVDAFMTMDCITPPPSWSWWLGALPRIPLHGVKSPWSDDSFTYSYDHDLETWTGAAVPAAKVVFGVGGYGEVWADTNGDGKAPAAAYTNRAVLANDPTCGGSGPCIQAADTETDPIGCSDNHVTQQWVDQVVAASGGKLTLEQNLDGRATYWGAPGPSQLVSAAGPCGGTIQIGSIMYESPLSMTWKAEYVKEKGAGGLMFWTLSELRNASGAYPILEAVKP